MFCYQCGFQLPNGAKFCPNCGSSVIPCQPNTGVTTSQSNDMPLPAVAKIYNDIYQLAESSSRDFVITFSERYSSLEMFVSKGLSDISALFSCTEKYVLELLHRQGHYHYGESDISPYTRKYMGYTSEVLSKFIDAYQEIAGAAEEAHQYNQYLKNNHSRFVGGGFGLSGALKGMATAGALNAVAGVFQSYSDNKRDRSTEEQISTLKRKLYNDYTFRAALQTAIEFDIKESIHGICDLFAEFGLERIPFFPQNNLMQCANILDSIISGKIPQSEIERVAQQVIDMYPVHRDAYFYAMEICPEKRADFLSMANKYGIDIDAYIQNQVTPRAKNLLANSIAQFLLERGELSGNLDDCLNSIELGYHDFWGERFWLCMSKQQDSRWVPSKIRAKYADCAYDEIPILCLDVSKYHSGDDGLLLTDKMIHAHAYDDKNQGCLLKAPLANFKKLSLIHSNCLELAFESNSYQIPLPLGDWEAQLFVDLLNFFVCYQLYLQNMPATYIRPSLDQSHFATQVLQYAGLSRDSILPPSIAKIRSHNDTLDDEDLDGDNLDDVLGDRSNREDINEEEIISAFEKLLFSKRKKLKLYKDSIKSAIDHKTNGFLCRDLNIMKKVYSDAYNAGELFLFFCDPTIGGTFKESFLMTDQRFHCHSEKYGSWSIPYLDIESVSMEGSVWTYLAINGKRVPFVGSDSDIKEMIYELTHWFFPFLECLYMEDEEEDEEDTKRFCFECGAENDASAEFCFECGAPLT